MGFGSGEGFTPGRHNLVGDFTVEGNMSASAAISGGFFFGDGSFLQNVTGSGGGGGGISFNGSTANGLVSYGDASTADVESNLTFNGSLLSVGASSTATLSASSNITGSTLKLEHGLTASSVFIGGPMGTIAAESGSALYVSGAITGSGGICVLGAAPRVALQVSSALDAHTAIQFWKGDRNALGKWMNFYAREWRHPTGRTNNADGRIELKIPHLDLPAPGVDTIGDHGFLFHNAQTSSYVNFLVACTSSNDYITFGFNERENSEPAFRIYGNGKIQIDCGNVDTGGTYAGTTSPAKADNQFILEAQQMNFGTASNCTMNVTGGIRVIAGSGDHTVAGYVSASTGITGSSFWIGGTGTGITNTGVVSAHLSLSSSNGITGSSYMIDSPTGRWGLTNAGALAANKIELVDDEDPALNITEGGNSYIKVVTANGSEEVVFGKAVDCESDLAVDGTVTLMDGGSGVLNINSYATVTSAGSNQGDAAAAIKYYNNVQGGDGTKGVVLPAGADSGRVLIIWNGSSGGGLKIYPNSGGTINGGSANAAVTLGTGGKIAHCVLAAANTWVVMGEVS